MEEKFSKREINIIFCEAKIQALIKDKGGWNVR